MRTNLGLTCLVLVLALSACVVRCVQDSGNGLPNAYNAVEGLPADIAPLYCQKVESCDPAFFERVFYGYDDCVALATYIVDNPEGECTDDPTVIQPLLDDLGATTSCNRVFQNTRALTLLLIEYGVCVR